MKASANFKYLPKGYRWICSWKVVKGNEFERLKALEAKYQNVEAEFSPVERLRARTRDQEYMWLDFLWILKTDFWLNYEHVSSSAAGDGFLTPVLGPLCPDCKRDLSSILSRGESVCLCLKTFEIGKYAGRKFPVSALRRAAYEEAQASVRKNELQKS